ncbi:MAG: hypothetical protein ACREP3_18495 [Candidatus Binatia bacterium]
MLVLLYTRREVRRENSNTTDDGKLVSLNFMRKEDANNESIKRIADSPKYRRLNAQKFVVGHEESCAM